MSLRKYHLTKKGTLPPIGSPEAYECPVFYFLDRAQSMDSNYIREGVQMFRQTQNAKLGRGGGSKPRKQNNVMSGVKRGIKRGLSTTQIIPGRMRSSGK